jgi:hypothetical protein
VTIMFRRRLRECGGKPAPTCDMSNATVEVVPPARLLHCESYAWMDDKSTHMELDVVTGEWHVIE